MRISFGNGIYIFVGACMRIEIIVIIIIVIVIFVLVLTTKRELSTGGFISVEWI